MAAPFSKDLRERIIIKHKKGIKPTQIQKELEIKFVSAICAIIKRYDETGSTEPHPLNNGKPPKMTEKNTSDLKQRFLHNPMLRWKSLRNS